MANPFLKVYSSSLNQVIFVYNETAFKHLNTQRGRGILLCDSPVKMLSIDND